MYVYMYVYMCVCIYTWIYVFIYVRVCECVCVCVCVCMCANVLVFSNILASELRSLVNFGRCLQQVFANKTPPPSLALVQHPLPPLRQPFSRF